MSLSPGERGLKLILYYNIDAYLLSLSPGERGLKYKHNKQDINIICVALPRRAWIEIQCFWAASISILGRSPQESVDWNLVHIEHFICLFLVALPRRAWIEISENTVAVLIVLSRSPQESVDWNQILYRVLVRSKVWSLSPGERGLK